jgi:hypothetical protein
MFRAAVSGETPTERLANFLFFTTPTWSGALLGAWALFRDAVPAHTRNVVDFVVLIFVGVTITLLMWAIDRRADARRVAQQAQQYNQVREAMGLIPSPQLIRGLVGSQPESFLQFLASERATQERGFNLLKSNQKWPLTTPRAYETIIHFLKDAEEFLIIDQDIRRWFEILDQEGQQVETSTTFNYSQYILDLTEKAVERRKLRSYKRVFMVNSHALSCLQNEHAAHDIRAMPPATRVLLTIWDFESRLQPVLGDNCGSRIMLMRPTSANPLQRQRIAHYKDVVLVNQEVCMQEDLLYESQSSPRTSFLTESFMYTGGELVKDGPDFIGELWQKALGPEDFPAFKSHLENLRSGSK